MERVSSTEFNLWVAYYARKDKEKWRKGASPEHYYLAQVTGMVATALSDKSYGTSDFLLEFEAGDGSTSTAPKQSAADIKNLLLAQVGIR
jgi:hypothetical protein